MTIANGIEAGIKSAIDAMTTAGGYNFNYNNINEFRPLSKTYPSVEVFFSPEVLSGYDIVDAYSVTRECLIKASIGTSSDVNADLNKVLQDFKRLFADNDTTLRNLGQLDADYSESNVVYTHVRARPAYITIKFILKYRIKMSNTASAV